MSTLSIGSSVGSGGGVGLPADIESARTLGRHAFLGRSLPYLEGPPLHRVDSSRLDSSRRHNTFPNKPSTNPGAARRQSSSRVEHVDKNHRRRSTKSRQSWQTRSDRARRVVSCRVVSCRVESSRVESCRVESGVTMLSRTNSRHNQAKLVEHPRVESSLIEKNVGVPRQGSENSRQKPSTRAEPNISWSGRARQSTPSPNKRPTGQARYHRRSRLEPRPDAPGKDLEDSR